MSSFPLTRLRRLRQHPKIRTLTSETTLQIQDLIQPIFITADDKVDKKPIASMPGQYQWSLQGLESIIKSIDHLKVPAVILFGIPSYKDHLGTAAALKDGIIQQAIKKIKLWAPDLLILADLCLCEYTDHGHCGILKTSEKTNKIYIENDQTLTLLAKQAITLAEAGADVVAPSGMMDGSIKHVRLALDKSGYSEVAIWSYAVKYASAFYYPFREAAEGKPQCGDRKTYQMDINSSPKQALREVALDIQEGADALIVKPAQSYLDILHQVHTKAEGVPVLGYQVSGTYAMLKAAASLGILEEKETVYETLIAIKRAGACSIITYYACEVAAWLQHV